MGIALRVVCLMLLYVGAHGITLQSFATNAGTAATNNCQCSISSGACQSVPYGCMHGMLLKIQGSNNWNSPVIQFTTLYSEETSATPPICEGTTTSSQKLGCVLHAESTGQFQMTVTNSGDSTPIEIVMNVTAPEFIIVEQVTESSCRGAPGELVFCGLSPFGTHSGNVVRLVEASGDEIDLIFCKLT